MRRRLALLALLVLLAAARRQRAEPNDWFADLIAEDAMHDHSGELVVRHNHTCCHKLGFDHDPVADTALTHVEVPYNHWWRTGATLVAVAPDLESPSPRMIAIGEAGLVLDFRARSRLYVRLQCAYPCCLESAFVLMPDGAVEPLIAAGNATVGPRAPWRHDPLAALAAQGYVLLGDHYKGAHQHEVFWAERTFTSRIDALQLCDTDATGLWIQIDSPQRVVASLLSVDVCFIHHDMVLSWETTLCEEN